MELSVLARSVVVALICGAPIPLITDDEWWELSPGIAQTFRGMVQADRPMDPYEKAQVLGGSPSHYVKHTYRNNATSPRG